jgi:hypothetical protein
MRKLLSGLLAFFIAASAFSQQSSLKGVVTDTSEKKDLVNAVVTVLRSKDSVLVSFARTKADGSFAIPNLKPGNYIISVSRPKYAGYTDKVEIKENENKDLGKISIISAGRLLEEIVIKQNRAIVIKGDTIEYKADSFKVAEGANVQDLLKRMPGLEVDRNGQITAQGQKVERVLVDGEEFFSDDPAVVTQNIRADAIEKVQAYDKKSDQAEFTGVDDGVKSKTLNLVLKEDKKKGYFGKVSVGGGTNGRYNEEGMFNYFKGKKKASAYGIASNTGKIGLGWEDADKFGGGNGFGDGEVEMGAGYIMITNDNYDNDFSDWGDNYWGEGVPRSIKTGVHFSNKWLRDKNDINGNYSYKKQWNDAEGGSLNKYILPDSAYYNFENHRNISTESKQLFTGRYSLQIDSLTSVTFRLNGLKGKSIREQYTNSGADDENQQAVNRNKRDYLTNSDNESIMGSFLLKKKFKKTGRTISWSGSYKVGNKNSFGYLNSYTDFYDPLGQIVDQDSIEQYKDNTGRNKKAQSRIAYTEPLTKKILLELNYTFGLNNTLNDQRTYDKSNNGKYEDYNQTFSNRYSLNILSNSGGAKFQYNGKKVTGNVGLNIGHSSFLHKDSADKQVNKFNYTNLLPTARLNFKLATQRGLNFNYSGNTQPPSINQIQPLRENIDPLNVTIGNPDLKQSFTNNLSVMYNDFKTLTGRSIWLNGSISFTNDAIVPSQTIAAGGKRTVQYVNTNGNYNARLYTSYHFKWAKPDIGIRIGPHLYTSRQVNYVNGVKNTSNNANLSIGTGINKYKNEKYSIYYDNSFGVQINKSSISTRKTSLWSQSHNLGMDFYFKKEKYSIGSDINIDLREKTDAFDKNNNVYNWSAYIKMKVMKKKGELKLQAFDILNQKIGYDRNTTSNYISERTYEVLRRYVMLSFIYNFSKNPGQK